MTQLSLALTRLYLLLAIPPDTPRRRDERGDVPGWVMITVMTAGLVVVIGSVARTQLSSMLNAALNQVK